MSAPRVWKWELQPQLPKADEVGERTACWAATVAMPEVADPLHVEVLNRDELYLWALVDPTAQQVTRRFAVAETGAELGPFDRYVGTVLLHDGARVYHVFEMRDAPA